MIENFMIGGNCKVCDIRIVGTSMEMAFHIFHEHRDQFDSHYDMIYELTCKQLGRQPPKELMYIALVSELEEHEKEVEKRR